MPGDPGDIEALLATARGGDRDALVSLLAAVGPQVRRRIAGRIPPALRPSIEEDDVMQVTFLEACLGIGRFVSGGVPEFIAWLTRLAENNLIDAIRALESGRRPNPRRRIEPAAREDSYLGLAALLGTTSSTPSLHAARGEVCAALDAALRSLPPDYERVVRMYDLEGRSVAEVAAELKRSEGAVYMLRARAHERLKDELGASSRYFSKGS
ncbi:MAG: sigma-70 family RNA polymerase sigma factor [Phycisphaerales bacterium]|nr:sigma-70 family RNA polymerase sigma factor [Phycisphaerales bacterium]